MTDSLGEVIGAGKWEKALFTTFSLSLTFFESVLLRALRKADCREIWVLADADGYRSSLMERGSSAVGSEYHLIPIGLPNGVFHAKCCYLLGQEEDFLAIGSGNLTFGGFGRNLEVLDLLSSQEYPQCFRSFGDFLTSLKKRDDIICPDFSWADIFANRAYEVSTGRGDEREEYPKLITTAEESVKDQLVKLFAASGKVEGLTILSPYFDPDGRAVLDLATVIQTNEVRISLPPGNALSSFPFPKAKKWPVKFSTVRLRREQEKRPLHAKWLEWRTSAGIFALTGSVNATEQALCSTNNIEVGVLRFDPSGKGWADWEKAPIPSSFQAHSFRRAGMGGSHLVFAELTESGELRGRIISLKSPEGVWAGTVQKANGDSVEVELKVQVDGRFSHHLAGGEDFLLANGLQIIVERDSVVARGWVTNTTLLSLPKTQRIPLSSILRLINREETVEDDLVLLEYLVVHATDHLRVFQSRVTATREDSSIPLSEQEAFSIDLDYLRPQEAADSHQNSMSSDPVMSLGLALERVFAQLRKRFVGHVARSQRSSSRLGADDANEEEVAGEDGVKGGRLHERFESAFECFMEGMHDLVERTDVAQEHRRALLVLWLEVALHMLVRRKRERAEGVAFMNRWLRLATAITSAGERTDGLEQHVVTSAAILLACNADSEDTALLHEALERYWRGDVDRERAEGALLPHSRLSITGMFLEPSGTTLPDNLENILNTPTLRRELEAALSNVQNGEALPENLHIFQSAAGRELRDELKARGLSRRIEILQADKFICPSQFIRLSEVCKGELLRDRVARCSVCGALIIRRSP